MFLGKFYEAKFNFHRAIYYVCSNSLFKGLVKYGKLFKSNNKSNGRRLLTDWVFTVFNHLTPVVFFYSPLKRQKTRGFLMFSEGIEKDQRHEMGQCHIIWKVLFVMSFELIFFLNSIGFTHLVCESVAVCVHQTLSPSHPVFRLIAPHFLYLLAINK